MLKKTKMLIIAQAAAAAVGMAAILVCALTSLTALLYVLAGCFVVFCIFVGIYIYTTSRAVQTEDDLLSQMEDCITGGMVEFYLDKNLTVKRMSDRLLRHMGYTEQSFNDNFDGKLINAIAPEYRDTLPALLRAKTNERNAQTEFRLLCNAQSSIPVIAVMRYSRRHTLKGDFSKIYVTSLIINTSAIKQGELERDIESERYKIVAEQSDSIIFDYNIFDYTLYLNSNFEKKFGYNVQVNEDLRNVLRSGNFLHRDDVERITGIHFSHTPYTEADVRIRKANGEYIWCNIRMSALYNKAARPARIIGKIIDVDAPLREKEVLLEKTKRDIMTGLYNKTATEALVAEIIKTAEPDALFALVLFDIDNFKRINDDFGHITGDRVLSKISEDIKMIFRSTDIIGRVGGDEFVVFIKDLPSERHAIKKAASILSIIYNGFTMENDGFVVSSSMGISFFNRDGATYHELFERADDAMYASKRRGKNTYTIYDKSLQKETDPNGAPTERRSS